MRRAAIIVLDGVGIGSAPDAHLYGDDGSNTLGNVARAVGGLSMPASKPLVSAAAPSPRSRPGVSPRAAHGLCEPASPGKTAPPVTGSSAG